MLFIILFFCISIIPLQSNFLGGGIDNYLNNPTLFSWVNFDGEHYFSIAMFGYRPLTYFYFPVYPQLIKILSQISTPTLINFAISGLLISNASFLVALFGLYKLLKFDFKDNITLLTIVFLIVFPTSFYFGSYYTESLFLALSVWAIYFVRKSNFLAAGILSLIASATRVVGVSLFFVLLIEYFQLKKDKKISKDLLFVFLAPLGLLIYMYFLNLKTGDPLEFLHSVSIFGPQRSASFILLPQVFYRYVFKIIPSINYNYFPVVFTTFLEFGTASLFVILLIYSFFKLRLSYSVYFALTFLIPTLSGSFSSLPRYVLVCFPAFIILSHMFQKKKKFIKPYLIFNLVLLIVASSLFLRGYWIS